MRDQVDTSMFASMDRCSLQVRTAHHCSSLGALDPIQLTSGGGLLLVYSEPPPGRSGYGMAPACAVSPTAASRWSLNIAYLKLNTFISLFAVHLVNPEGTSSLATRSHKIFALVSNPAVCSGNHDKSQLKIRTAASDSNGGKQSVQCGTLMNLENGEWGPMDRYLHEHRADQNRGVRLSQ